MQKISTCLWYNGQAEAAVRFYRSIFKKSKTGRVTRWGKDVPGRKGAVLTVEFSLEGQDFIALNGGPEFKFTPAVSFQIHCNTQKEIDTYWRKLLAGGGQESQCGWLSDKYGMSWQVVPTVLPKMLNDRNPARVTRVTHALMRMVKLDIAALTKAYKG